MMLRALPALLLLISSFALAQDDPALPPGIPRTIKDEVRRTYQVLLSGDVAYLASTVGVVVADIKDPSKPRYLGGLLLPDSVNALALLDRQRLLVANGPSGLSVVDVADPARPKRTAVLRLAGAAIAVDAAGTTAVVALGTLGVQVLELKDHPRAGDRRDTPGYARDVRLAGDVVYVADGDAGVQILRLKQGKLAPLSAVGCQGHVFNLALQGKMLYAAAGHAGLLLIDVTRPEAPRVLGRLRARDAIRGVAISGTSAVVADGTAGVARVDLSKPAAPRETGRRHKLDRSVNRVTLRRDLAFVANDYDGLLVLRIPPAGDPTFVASLPPKKQGK
jgi:hypothetical protein